MLNALYTAMQNGEGHAMVGQVLAGLATYTENHFAYEEKLFFEHDYPDALEHKMLHADLIGQVAKIQAKYDSGSTMLSMEVVRFLKQWLLTHIQGTDRAYVSYLIAKGVT